MKLSYIAILCFTFFTSIAHADFVITNHTEFYGSAVIEHSPCSSTQGDKGILKPFGKLVVPNIILAFFCPNSTCNVHTFLSKDCSGPEIATINISQNDGVLDIAVHDPQFIFTASKFNIDIFKA